MLFVWLTGEASNLQITICSPGHITERAKVQSNLILQYRESAINTQMIAPLRQSKNDSLPFPKLPLNARRGPWGIERALYSGSVRLHVCDHGHFKQIRNEREYGV